MLLFPPAAFRRLTIASVLLLITAIGGCERSEGIAHYRVPKEREVSIATPADESDASAETVAPGEETDRMLAAIVAHGNSAWTFKLTGPIATIDKYADAFQSLVQSITFPATSGAQPQWKLPEGWQQKAGGSAMRLATITIPDEQPPLEATV